MEPDPNATPRGRETRASKTPAPKESTRAQAASDAGIPAGHGMAQDRPKSATRGRKDSTSRQVLVGRQVPMLDIEAAMKEITLVPAATIHRDAAFTWASRAIAAYRVCARKQAVQEGLSYLYLGEHYREAALAHAAMGEAWQPLFAEIDEAMAKDRASAFTSMRGRSPVATR